MSVIATPVVGAPPSSLSCADQPILVPTAYRQYGCEVKARRRSVEAMQGQTTTIKWQMLNPQGNPVDLSSCGNFPTFDLPDDVRRVVLRTRETVIVPQNCADPE